MAYNLYPEQGGITATFVNPKFISATGTDVGIAPPHAHMKTGSPWGLYATTTDTIFVTDTTYFQYIGTIYKAVTSIKVVYNLNATMATDIEYGEIALFKGDLGDAVAPASLTRLGFVNCNTSGQFLHAPGLLMAQMELSVPTKVGDDLWLAFASKATTPAQFEALLIDRMGTGFFCSVAGRPSTITNPCVTAAVNSTVSGVASYIII